MRGLRRTALLRKLFLSRRVRTAQWSRVHSLIGELNGRRVLRRCMTMRRSEATVSLPRLQCVNGAANGSRCARGQRVVSRKADPGRRARRLAASQRELGCDEGPRAVAQSRCRPGSPDIRAGVKPQPQHRQRAPWCRRFRRIRMAIGAHEHSASPPCNPGQA